MNSFETFMSSFDFSDNDENSSIQTKDYNITSSNKNINPKKYIDFLEEIDSDTLYERLVKYGLFSSKLPPVFDMNHFFNEYRTFDANSYMEKSYGYIQYNSMRNTNIPRPIGIPTPMGHDRLCKCLKENWEKLLAFFENSTRNQSYKISRIHIRKNTKNDAIFDMTYKNWREDGSPEEDLAIGKKFLVYADISKCFPSVYTHALTWALVGKSQAKQNRDKKNAWYNLIDQKTQNSKNGETHGILIGPHTSNILSEILLCKIDEELSSKWDYIRHIDDFKCYVKTREDADVFLLELNNTLKKNGFSVNHEKTKIFELPVCDVEQWTTKINDREFYLKSTKNGNLNIGYNDVKSFFNFGINLMHENNDNPSIILYIMQTIKRYYISKNAIIFLTKKIISMSLIYPYIVPLLGDIIFSRYQINKDDIKKYTDIIYNTYINTNHLESCSFSLYYAIKYKFTLENFSIDSIMEKNDCILSLLAFIYCIKNNDSISIKKLEDFAIELKANGEMDEQWIFIYELLSETNLEKDWKRLKKKNISFLKSEFR